MEFEQLLEATRFTTSQTVKMYEPYYIENGYLDYINLKEEQEILKLQNECPVVNNDVDFMRTELNKYAKVLVPKIKEEYGELIPNEYIKILEKLLDPSSIVIIYDSKSDHDISANAEVGQVIVNLAKIRGDDIYGKVISAKGSLPHEIFHHVIQILKNKDLADDRMIIDLIDGEQIRSRGMVGFMINEGLAEKYTIDFCNKYNFYSKIAPQYIPYINICNYILSKDPKLSSMVFSLKYEDMLSYLTEEEKKAYMDAECVSYAVRHKKVDLDKIASVRVEKVNLTNNSSNEKILEFKKMLVDISQATINDNVADTLDKPKTR